MQSVLTLSLVLAPALASALTPAEMLQKIDDAINPYQDRRMGLKMWIREPSGATREVEMKIAERGRGRQRLMLFTAPADIKGMGVLVEDRNTLYVYLPSYHRVRRVAMHARKQTFQGSDFTFDDMAQITYAPDYDAKVLREEAKHYMLELTPKPGKELQYSRLLGWANRETWHLERIEYYDESGTHTKTETRWDYKPVNGVPIQSKIRMVDERTKHQTDIEVTELAVNLGLSRRLFTKRGLIRGKL
jgi:outer membrane lipoprotein-sorting protein